MSKDLNHAGAIELIIKEMEKTPQTTDGFIQNAMLCGIGLIILNKMINKHEKQ